MPNLREMIQSVRTRTRIRRARLPWRALEAEAARQGCSPADIFFDWAGREKPSELAEQLRDVSLLGGRGLLAGNSAMKHVPRERGGRHRGRRGLG